MPCDKAGCTAPATIEKDAWAFCATHAGGDAAPAVAPRTMTSSAPSPVRPGITAPPAAEPMSPERVTLAPIGLLLEEASSHSSKRVQSLATRIEADLDKLRELIKSLADSEARKQAEKAAKEAARAEVARLEQQLAAAKAKLRKPAASSSDGPSKRTWSGDPLVCRKGCGKTSPNPQGRAAHERHCTA